MGFWDALRFWDDKRERRTEVHVRLHKAYRLGDPTEYYFVNVLNASPEREVTVTHVWFATDPEQHILNPERPLSARIAPRDQWETWYPVSLVPAAEPEVWMLARAQLADDTVIVSTQRADVPAVGHIPGA